MYKKNYFNFKKFENKYLLTNDLGNYAFINERDFQRLINSERLPNNINKELENKQFIYNCSDEEFVKYHYKKLSEYKNYLNECTVLHIFVVSKNCNYNCIYCQAGNLNQKKEEIMSQDVARYAVDIAFESPSQFLTFEFQGGEPLTNFEIIKYIVEYSKIKNNELNDTNNQKSIEFNLVSNLSLLTNEIKDFLIENNFSVCTSIDGDSKLQNINRPYNGNDSYKKTVDNMKLLQNSGVRVSAILTTTKFSLNKYKDIVDEYINLGLNSITLRPLTRLGKADENWKHIAYSSESFIEFYKNALKYIINKNKNGTFLAEGFACILLSKILNGKSINYMELRSPCGGAIGQIAYYYDGNIYTCDEGRMLAEMGDKKFLLGDVFNNTYKDLITCECTKDICRASCLEGIATCHNCVYMPYCGTCPVLNYSQTGSMLFNNKKNFKCEITRGILDALFYYIKNDKRAMKIFNSWI